jgi:Glycosyl transferase family 2
LSSNGGRLQRVRDVTSLKIERMIERAIAPRTDALRWQLESVTEEVSRLQGASDAFADQVRNDLSRLEDELAELRSAATESMGGVTRSIVDLDAQVSSVRRIAAAALDDIPRLRHQLLAARATEVYEQALSDPEPLVTIRIPTYVRADLLVERALPSIAKQSYQNFEVIVVGDGCTNDVAELVEAFGDPRVQFVNLPYRFPYPPEREHRWMVAGAPGVNVGTELARGAWLAMLGDDDEFEPHHLECLLERARGTRSEMVYGDLVVRQKPPKTDEILARYPPELGWFNFQGAIFMTALSFFEFSTSSWVLDEPSDWNLCRRMLESGVRIGHVDRVVTVHFPSHIWEPDQRGL